MLFKFALQLMFYKSSLPNIFLCYYVTFAMERIRCKIKRKLMNFIRLISLRLLDVRSLHQR